MTAERGHTGRDHHATVLVLNYAFARDRMHKVRKLGTAWRDRALPSRLWKPSAASIAQVVLDRARRSASADRTGAGAGSMKPGDAVRGRNAVKLFRAQRAIARCAARAGFLFGCNCFGLALRYP